MNLTLEAADIVSVKPTIGTENYPSIETEIKEALRNGKISAKIISPKDLPKTFEGFFWTLKNKTTMIAICTPNTLDFTLYIIEATLPKYLSDIQGLRTYNKVKGYPNKLPTVEKTEDTIQMQKTVNPVKQKINIVTIG